MKTVPFLAACAALAAGFAISGARANESPRELAAAPSAAAPAPGLPPGPVRTYWRDPRTLWVLDATPEVGIGANELGERETGQIRGAGIRLVRHTLYWDPRYPGALDGAVAAARRSGLELVVVVHNGGHCRERFPDPHGTFAAFMAAQARRHPSVRYWQLWNEQDTPGWTNFFGGQGKGNCRAGNASVRQQGAEYARMLRQAYPAIKRANPNAYVLVGGLTGFGGWEFLHGMYEGGARPYFDFMAIHVYGSVAQYDAGNDGIRSRGQGVAQIMARHGDAGRPLWLTEFGTAGEAFNAAWGVPHAGGREDGPIYDTHQRDWWHDALNVVGSSGIYAKAIGYVLHGPDGAPRPGCRGGGVCWPAPRLPRGRVPEDYGFGLFRRDGVTPRPAYTYLRERNFNAPVQRAARRQAVRVRSPNLDPSGYEFRRTGEYVEILDVPVNSLTPTAITFVARAR